MNNTTPIILKTLELRHEQMAVDLYENAFPYKERRPSDKWLEYFHTNSKFCIKSILLDDSFTGFLSYWDFDNFIYIEHFATLPSVRGLGLGGTSIDLFKESQPLRPIILEVEPPTDEITKRRINFYSRHGFHLIPNDYEQPSYHEGGTSFPLLIMCNDKNFALNQFKSIVRVLHQNVYGVIFE